MVRRGLHGQAGSSSRPASVRGHDEAIRLADDLSHLVPVGVDVEVDADPATVSDVRRPEELVGLGVDELGLDTGGRRAPDRDAVGAVVVVVQRAQRRLVADEERGCAVARALGDLGELGTDAPEACERVAVIRHEHQCRRATVAT